MNQHIIGGNALPKKVEDIMDDEEELVLCVDTAAEQDQGLAARHRLRIASVPIPAQHTRAHALCPCAIAHPFRDVLPCPDSAWMMQPPVLLTQVPGSRRAPGTCRSALWAGIAVALTRPLNLLSVVRRPTQSLCRFS